MDTSRSGSDQRRRPGPRPKLGTKERKVLIRLVRENPRLALDDLVAVFRRETGISVSAPTIGKCLAEEGFQRARRPRRGADREQSQEQKVAVAVAPKPASQKTYGYDVAHRDCGDAVRYPCGLTDSEWEQVRHLFESGGKAGNPGKYPRRQMLDACIYVLRSGCSWRMLPKDLPPWTAVYKTFRRWTSRGLFETMHDELRALWRSRQHREPDPSAVVLDSQSVRTSPQGGPKGYDAGKKIKGRKRHLVTDTLGLMIAVVVTAASVQDRDAAVPVMDLAKAKVPSLQKLYVDSSYAGGVAETIRDRHQIQVEVVRHPGNRNVGGPWYEGQIPLFEIPAGFTVLPKRWVIERTNAWNDRPRRMNKDHDRVLAVSTAWIWLTEGRILLRRLTSTPQHV